MWVSENDIDRIEELLADACSLAKDRGDMYEDMDLWELSFEIQRFLERLGANKTEGRNDELSPR